MTPRECPRCGFSLSECFCHRYMERFIEKPAPPKTIHDVTLDDVIEAMPPAAPAPREYWLLTEVGSNRALLRQPGEKWATDINGEPGNEWLHVIEKSAYAAVVKERDELIKEIEDRESREFAHADDNNKTFYQLREQVARLEGELEGLKRLSSYANQTYGQQQSNLARFSGEVERLERELSEVLQVKAQAVGANEDLHNQMEKLQAEVASLKDQLEWSLRNEEKQKQYYANKHEDFMKAQAEVAELTSTCAAAIDSSGRLGKDIVRLREELTRVSKARVAAWDAKDKETADLAACQEENKRLRGALEEIYQCSHDEASQTVARQALKSP